MRVTVCGDIQFSNSKMSDFYFAGGFTNTDNLRILNNDIHGIDFDGLRLGQVTNTLIQGNRLHDFDGTRGRRPPGHDPVLDRRRPAAPSANVTIRDNDLLDIGDGRMIQSLFIYNEAVLRKAPARTCSTGTS